jgi:hypothetical protein
LSLPGFGTNALVAIPQMIVLVQETDTYCAAHAATALGEMGSAARVALPAIQPLTTNREPPVRRKAAVAMWRIDPNYGFPLDIFRWNMQHAELQERALAARQLWMLDRGYKREVLETLQALLSAPPTRVNGMKEPYYGPQRLAADGLGSMGAEAEVALGALNDLANYSEDKFFRNDARAAYEKISVDLNHRK